jgi:hypothetical protein
MFSVAPSALEKLGVVHRPAPFSFNAVLVVLLRTINFAGVGSFSNLSGGFLVLITVSLSFFHASSWISSVLTPLTPSCILEIMVSLKEVDVHVSMFRRSL